MAASILDRMLLGMHELNACMHVLYASMCTFGDDGDDNNSNAEMHNKHRRRAHNIAFVPRDLINDGEPKY